MSTPDAAAADPPAVGVPAGIAGPGPSDAPVTPHPGRVVLVPAALAHLFALVGMVTGWGSYRAGGPTVLAFAVSVLVPVLLVRGPRRAGGPPAGTIGLALIGLVIVAVTVLADLPASAWASWAAWPWGTGAMTLMGLGLFVPVRVTFALAGVHGAAAAGVVLAGGLDPFAALVVTVLATVPPLAAAQYLKFYAEALAFRASAVRAEERARRAEDDAGRLAASDVRRLGALDLRIRPLLERVASGGPVTAADAGAARQLATELREALVARRRSLWLPEDLAGTSVTLVATATAEGALDDDRRVWLLTLLDLLGRHAGWRRVSVVLDVGRRGGAGVPGRAGAVTAVVTATGPEAAAAARDGRIVLHCTAVGARCDLDGDHLIVEADPYTQTEA